MALATAIKKKFEPVWRSTLDFCPRPARKETSLVYHYIKEATVVGKIVHKIASVWCKIALEEVGVSLP